MNGQLSGLVGPVDWRGAILGNESSFFTVAWVVSDRCFYVRGMKGGKETGELSFSVCS